ncbi:MAG: CDP-alcohol phosphatidyltransferase family protein [Candidatus Margulisbacteria bacterium]|nr:CDP-alcohol phosphatidyltransferase family protein [Candidatus Margulisiibacteriota bacterium]
MAFKIKLISERLEKWGKERATHYSRILMNWGVTPNGLTTFGLLINFTSAYFVLRGQLILGAIFLVLGGLFDLLDGSLARVSKNISKFGSFWDSVADRIAEAFFYLALIIYFVTSYNYFAVLFALFAMAGSWLVTYTRSCAESYKIKVEEDFLPHPERIIILAITLALDRAIFGLFVIAALTITTVVWRTLSIYRHFQIKQILQNKEQKKVKT